jgi:hypothetical protein
LTLALPVIVRTPALVRSTGDFSLSHEATSVAAG